MSKEATSSVFWVEAHTGPIDNFTMAVAIAADRLRRDLEHDRAVSDASVAGSDLDRTLSFRVTVEADHALAAVHLVMTIVERSTKKHSIGDLAMQRLTSLPADGPADPTRIDTHGYEKELEAKAAAAAPRPVPAVRPDPANAQHAAFGAALAMAGARHLAVELHNSGGNDSARSLERWLEQGISAQEALRGLHHVLVELRAMSSMAGWAPGVGQRIDRVLADVVAALDHPGH